MIIYLKQIIRYNLVGFLSETWSNNKLKNTFNFVLMIIGIEFMVLSFFYRWIFSFLLILYSCLLARLKVHNQNQVKILNYCSNNFTTNYKFLIILDKIQISICYMFIGFGVFSTFARY